MFSFPSNLALFPRYGGLIINPILALHIGVPLFNALIGVNPKFEMGKFGLKKNGANH